MLIQMSNADVLKCSFYPSFFISIIPCLPRRLALGFRGPSPFGKRLCVCFRKSPCKLGSQANQVASENPSTKYIYSQRHVKPTVHGIKKSSAGETQQTRRLRQLSCLRSLDQTWVAKSAFSDISTLFLSQFFLKLLPQKAGRVLAGLSARAFWLSFSAQPLEDTLWGIAWQMALGWAIITRTCGSVPTASSNPDPQGPLAGF